MKELLGDTSYNQIRAALDKDEIHKLILSKKSDTKIQIPRKNLKKRSKEDSLLQCKEKIMVDSCQETPSKFSQSKLSKRDRKALRKRLGSPNFDKENQSILNMNDSKDHHFHSRRENLSQFNTPIKEEGGRYSILDRMLYKNDFESSDSKSYINMSIYDKSSNGATPNKKILGSPFKIRVEDLESVMGQDKLEENGFSPFQDKYRTIWRSYNDSDEKKHAPRLHNLSKALDKVVVRRSP